MITLQVAASGSTRRWVSVSAHGDTDMAFDEVTRIRQESEGKLDVRLLEDGDPDPVYEAYTSQD